MKSKIVAAIIALTASHGALAADEPTTVENQAAKNGYTVCAKDLVDTANGIIRDNDHGSLSTWHKSKWNEHTFNSLVGIKYSDGNSVAIINSIPNKEGKCDGNYTTVFALEESCAVARETTFKTWKYAGTVGGLLVLEDPKTGSANKILLPSAENGCTAITTETYYNSSLQ